MNGDPQRLLRRNAAAIQAGFAALWFVRGALNLGGPSAVASALAAIIPLAFAVAIWKVTGPLPTRQVMQSQEGRELFRPVTWMTTAQLAASVALPWWAATGGYPGWVLASIAITIGVLLVGLARPLGASFVAVVGAAITLVAITLPLVASGSTLAIALCSALGVLLTSSVVSLWAAAVRPHRIGVAPG